MFFSHVRGGSKSKRILFYLLGFSFSFKEEEKGKSKNIRRRRKRENNMRCGEEKKEMNEEMNWNVLIIEERRKKSTSSTENKKEDTLRSVS